MSACLVYELVIRVRRAHVPEESLRSAVQATKTIKLQLFSGLTNERRWPCRCAPCRGCAHRRRSWPRCARMSTQGWVRASLRLHRADRHQVCHRVGAPIIKTCDHPQGGHFTDFIVDIAVGVTPIGFSKLPARPPPPYTRYAAAL